MTDANTKAVELRIGTIEDLIDGLEHPNRLIQIRPRRREVIAAKLRDSLSPLDAIGFCGLPGAGKSYMAKKAGKIYKSPVVSMGDAIREQYKEQHGETPESEKLGEFAALWRDDDPEGIPDKVVEIAERENEDLIIIDGVRSLTDHEVLSDHFDRFMLIEVTAPFRTRLERIQNREREGEASFTADDLAERDKREYKKLGYNELQQTVFPDHFLRNDGGSNKATNNLAELVENQLPFEIADARPLGLSADLELLRREGETVAGFPK